MKATMRFAAFIAIIDVFAVGCLVRAVPLCLKRSSAPRRLG